MANTIFNAGIPEGGFDYAMGTGWIPYLLGMEELPGKEAFQRASVGTDLFKSLTDFMTNPTAGPLGLAATAGYGGPQAIAQGTQGKGLPELNEYRTRFDTMLNNLMGYSGTMNAQPADTQYQPPKLPGMVGGGTGDLKPPTPQKIDPNHAPTPSPEEAAKAPNTAVNWLIPPPPAVDDDLAHLALGGVVEMMLPPIEKKPNASGGEPRKMATGGEQSLPQPTPVAGPGSPVPSVRPTMPAERTQAPAIATRGDPYAPYGGKELVDVMKRYSADGGDVNKAVRTIQSIGKLRDMVRDGKIHIPQPPSVQPVAPPLWGPDMIRDLLGKYGSRIGFNPADIPGNNPSLPTLADGGGVVVGGQPHYVVDANGQPVAAITEDGKPEAVTGTDEGFEVTPLDPQRNAAYEASKRENSMGAAIAEADDFIQQATAPPIRAATGANVLLPTNPYVGGSRANISGAPLPTIGGPGQSREEQVGDYWKPKTEGYVPSLMDQMKTLPGNYNEQYARMLGGALSRENMAIPAEQLRALNAGRAPDTLLSGQALSSMSPIQRKGYAALLKQMGIIPSEEDLEHSVRAFTPAGLKHGGTQAIKRKNGPENRPNG